MREVTITGMLSGKAFEALGEGYRVALGRVPQEAPVFKPGKRAQRRTYSWLWNIVR